MPLVCIHSSTDLVLHHKKKARRVRVQSSGQPLEEEEEEEEEGKTMVKKNKSECSTTIVTKGAWTAEEDRILTEYVKTHGEKNWKSLPSEAGLSRCGKSCRLRWLNYLRPGIKRGNISEDEEDLIYRLHNLIGNRWALIAKRLPGRTDNEIKNHWNTHLSKKPFTISELNMKLSKKQETDADHSSAFSTKGPTSSRASGANWARTSHPDIKSEGFGDSELRSDPLSGLVEKDLSNDKHLGLYWASGLQDSGPHGTNRLVGNNPNFHKGETSKDCFNGKLHNQLDFDTLARWMEYQDDSF